MPWPNGGYSWEFLAGVCRLVLQMPTLFQTKKRNFPLKKILQVHFEFAYFSFFLIFGIDTINTFTHSRSYLPFSDQNGVKTLLDGAAHTYIAYIRESPPPPPGPGWLKESQLPTQATLGEPTFPTFPRLSLVNHFREYKHLLKLTFLFPRTTFLYYINGCLNFM